MLHVGEVYARSTSGGLPQSHSWLAMVKGHHAWKLTGEGRERLPVYGEHLYGVHSIECGEMGQWETLWVFASMPDSDTFDAFSKAERLAEELQVLIVPVLYRGIFHSSRELQEFLTTEVHRRPSALGGDGEGQ